MQQLYLSTLFFLFLLQTSSAQNKQVEKQLDQLFSSQFSSAQPGVEVLVAKKGQVIYKKAFGSANLELNVPLKADMVFNIASITKQFTAVAVLQLVDQGKISLQDSLQKYVPDFPAKGHAITIENLLTHTSGIPDYMQQDYQGTSMEKWDFTPKQLIDSFKNHSLQFEPGTQFSYSNSGYYLLGYIIQKLSGKSYQDYIRDHVLQPLGLTHSYFDRNGNLIPNRVNGYVKEGAVFKNADYWNPSIEYAAGGLISNVEDLWKWHQGLYTYQILKKETLQKAFTPFRFKNGTYSKYGYGWFLFTSNGISSIEHQGGLPGFKTNEVYYPEEDIFIAILSNSGAANIDALSINTAMAVLSKPLQANIKIDASALDKYVGVYQLTIDKGRTMTIYKEKDGLAAKVSATETFPVLFQSPTKFQFKNLLGADCEFIIENGKITKFTVSQNGVYEWIKMP